MLQLPVTRGPFPPAGGVRGRAEPEREPERSGGPQRPLTPSGGRAKTRLSCSKTPRRVDGSRGGRPNGRCSKDPRLVRKSAPVPRRVGSGATPDPLADDASGGVCRLGPLDAHHRSFASGISGPPRPLRRRDRLHRRLCRRRDPRRCVLLPAGLLGQPTSGRLRLLRLTPEKRRGRSIPVGGRAGPTRPSGRCSPLGPPVTITTGRTLPSSASAPRGWRSSSTRRVRSRRRRFGPAPEVSSGRSTRPSSSGI